MKTKKKSGKTLRKSGKSQGKIREFDGIKKVGTLSLNSNGFKSYELYFIFVGSGRIACHEKPECNLNVVYIHLVTRVHSSRMRTGRSLTVCCSLLPGRGSGLVPGEGGGGLVPGGWSGPWGVCSQGGCLVLGGGVSQHALRQTPSRPL